jgi:DNA-directed RNA polymerase subunit RPC12/RpoP
MNFLSEIKQYKCPYCAAELKFSPDKQKFTCEYCLSEFEENELVNKEKENEQESQANQSAQEEFEENTNLYSCPSCGAEVIADSNTAATFCYYCHNPVILSGRVKGEYRPSKVLPFELSKDKAVATFNNWSKKKWFIPKDFTSGKQIDKMTGLYVPFWVADTDTTASMDAIGEKIRTWRQGDYEIREISEFQVRRKAFIHYDGMPADGSKKIEDKLMEAIEPFDYTKTKDFSMAYLSGFLADKYDVGKEEIFPRIKERMTEGDVLILKDSARYDNLRNVNTNVYINNVKWHYMLLPVWFMTYKYKGETLEYALNGQSGKIAGRLPVSKFKQTIFSIIIGIIGFIIGGFIGGAFF